MTRSSSHRRSPTMQISRPRKTSELQARDSELPMTVSRPELLVDGSDRVYRRFVHALLVLSATHEAIRDGIAASIHLGGVQHTILQSIIHLGRICPVGVTEVANHLSFSVSFIAMETSKLQALGLVDKKQSSCDRRKVVLEVTKKGLCLFKQVAPLQRTVGDVQFGNLSEHEFADLVPMIDRLVEDSRKALLLLRYLEATNDTQSASGTKLRGQKNRSGAVK
jgi:MarR family transcriptional regulator, organic hydroperoxide resistance regulator